MRWLIALVVLAGCSACSSPKDAGSDRSAPKASRPKLPVDDDGAIAIEAVRSAARAEIQRLFGHQCDKIEVPERAFLPIDINGDKRPEYAVLLGRATCAADGNPPSSNKWLGTGGAEVMIWYATGWPPIMLLEHSMDGFTPLPDGLISVQHGGFCPNGTGPNACVVRYRWNDRDRALEPFSRRFYGGSGPQPVPKMRYEYEQISR